MLLHLAVVLGLRLDDVDAGGGQTEAERWRIRRGHQDEASGSVGAADAGDRLLRGGDDRCRQALGEDLQMRLCGGLVDIQTAHQVVAVLRLSAHGELHARL